jgi:probable phosphomutase (TIGR03848 family)
VPVPTVLLIRHGRTNANASGVLAGWTPGVELDDHGAAQARALAQRLAAVPLVAVISSPLERCRQTAELLTAVSGPKGRSRPQVVADERLGECRYGDWTGRELKTLVKDPLWKVVQQHPSAAVFPGPEGESMRAMQQRALDAVRDWDARVAAEHGDDAVWVAVSHGDVIKSVLADAVGAHLDEFQRITVAPASVSAVRYTATRPFLLRSNDVGGDLAGFVPAARRRRRPRSSGTDAVVGGGA